MAQCQRVVPSDPSFQLQRLTDIKSTPIFDLSTIRLSIYISEKLCHFVDCRLSKLHINRRYISSVAGFHPILGIVNNQPVGGVSPVLRLCLAYFRDLDIIRNK